MNDFYDNYIPEYDPEARDATGYHDDGYEEEEDDLFSDDEIRDRETGFCSRPPKKRVHRR